ncbi:hypothetical protein [Flavobacterium sp.]|uniref:hypothetical protein n=1 Tax=Flavobacterium sp. TaxID=239 RepID=UPI00286E2B81|nr:hypothetical protein [Flavobacterium sp.]
MKSFQEKFRIKSILTENKILFWLGTIHLVVFFFLLLYMPFNNTVVLGLNSVIKPIKFALSIWIYSWTMAIILQPINKITKVKIYSWVAVTAMSFEQIAITVQALRGELSHFNSSDTFGFVVFQLMGIFILTLTLWTGYMAYVFIKQKTRHIPPALVLSIKIGLIFFVIFSLFGGYIGGKTGHTVGAADGGNGLWFLNWSTLFGDLRVAHFFGIHSLQVIPLFGLFLSKFSNTSSGTKLVWIFSILYFLYVVFEMVQSVKGLPFIKI